MSYNFDRLTTPVAVQFYVNTQFKGNAVKSVYIYIVEKDEKEQENPSAE